MRVDRELIRRFLLRRDFADLFNYLGWNHPATLQPFPCEGWAVAPVAVQRGVGVWQIDGWPPAAVRRRIDREVSRRTRERLLIFDDGLIQHWLWPEMRLSGSGYRLVEHQYHRGTLNEDLIQRLAGAAFSIEEEDSLTVMDVLARVRRQFNAEPVTKRFYKDFRRHRDELVGRIEGIESEPESGWYGSVLLNRLMFIYFLQKKGFLADDPDYLRTRLGMVRGYLGKNAFYGFFRDFLLPLFHEGLGSHRREYDDSRIAEIVGEVPYVNGGIFLIHPLEDQYDIDIPDTAFEQIFDFFDRYRWHLDERPTDDPNEINPDVLGYVFEQYVNQKEQGAYYTKEDITGYMTGVTVIPALLDRFDLNDDPMDLLSLDPDRYIYESVGYGIDEPLPPDIQKGIDDPSRRGDNWFEKAPADIGLPGETWWETIDRHHRYRELRKRIEQGGIKDVNSAITANLDLRTLIIDFLDMLTPIEAVESAYRTLTEITVLDPTCGSGAFLFAALDVLAECYEVLLDRAEELSSSYTAAPPPMLREAAEHPNRAYFILKSVMLNNLYGVDIVPEACEIARLRMFLKLAAQLTEYRQIEPLPDLDFNIKTGNLLVGIAHQKDAEERIGMDLLGFGKLEAIEAAIAEVAALMKEFSLAQQRTDDPSRILELKSDAEKNLTQLRRQLDRNLYDPQAEMIDFDRWCDTHQPFHWFIEFPGIFKAGNGFDVIIGNPPYIKTKTVDEYTWHPFETNNCPDIYAICIERSLQLISSDPRFAMVLPISMQCGTKFAIIRKIFMSRLSNILISTYRKRPDSLFPNTQLHGHVILIGGRRADDDLTVLATRFNTWIKRYRPFLFENIQYTKLSQSIIDKAGWVKLGTNEEVKIIDKLLQLNNTVKNLMNNKGHYNVFYKATAWNYLSIFITPPLAYDEYGNRIEQSGIKELKFDDHIRRDAACAVLLGKLASMWWSATGDGFHLQAGHLKSMPLPAYLGFLLEAAELTPQFQEGLNGTVGYARNAGAFYGNYDARKIWYITDIIDKLILEEIGLEDHWNSLQLFYAQFTKQSTNRSVLQAEPDYQ